MNHVPPPFDPADPMSIRRTFKRATNNFSTDFSGQSILCSDNDDGETLNGQTGFFRHWPVMRAALEAWREINGVAAGKLHLLDMASSIGCTTNSYAGLAVAKKFSAAGGLKIDAFDRSALFTALARVRAYPAELVYLMELQWQKLLFSQKDIDDNQHIGLIPIREDVQKIVHFLDAQRGENFVPAQPYDMVMVHNVFQHINEDQTRKTIAAINKTNAALVFVVRNAKKHDVSLGAAYTPAHKHPKWRNTALVNGDFNIEKYYCVHARI